jgi:hypothetical protein
MKEMKKIIVIILISLLFVLSFKVLAGDINDPEIVDEEDDLFGSFIDHPIRFQIFQSIGLLTMDSFSFMDIKSAWFFEKSDEPNYLFASLYVKDLDVISQRVVYTIHWTFDGVRYAVGSHIYNNGKNSSCKVGFDRHLSIFCNFKDGESYYDFENDIITFKFKKEYAGNLQQGDVLTNTFAWTALRFNFERMTILFSDGELVKDAAPFIENSKDYGRYYVIKY